MLDFYRKVASAVSRHPWVTAILASLWPLWEFCKWIIDAVTRGIDVMNFAESFAAKWDELIDLADSPVFDWAALASCWAIIIIGLLLTARRDARLRLSDRQSLEIQEPLDGMQSRPRLSLSKAR